MRCRGLISRSLDHHWEILDTLRGPNLDGVAARSQILHRHFALGLDHLHLGTKDVEQPHFHLPRRDLVEAQDKGLTGGVRGK